MHKSKEMRAQSRYLLKKTNDKQLRSMYKSMAQLSRKRPRWNCQAYRWKNLALRSPEKSPKSEGATAEKLGKMACDRVSAEMEDDEVKEDEEVEFYLVEGGQIHHSETTRDHAGPTKPRCCSAYCEACGPNLRGKRQTKKQRKNFAESTRTEKNHSQRRKTPRKTKKMADRT